MRVIVTKIVEEDDDRVLLRGHDLGGSPLTFPLVYGAFAEQTRAIVEQVRAGQRPTVELPYDDAEED